MSPIITCAAILKPTLNFCGDETLLQNISYNLGLLEGEIDFTTK